MKEPLVSKELATLLKEKGFDWPTPYSAYLGEEPMFTQPLISRNGREHCLDYPTLSHAAIWLRKVHNLHIQIICMVDEWHYIISDTKDAFKEWGSETDYDTHDEALAAAIERALNELT